MPLQEVTNNTSTTAGIDGAPIKPTAVSADFDGAAFTGKVFAAWGAGKITNREQASEFYTEDNKLDLTTYAGLKNKGFPKDIYEGVDGMLEFLKTNDELFEFTNFNVISMINGVPGSNKVYFHHTKELVVKSTGKSTGVLEAIDIGTFRDGKICKWQGSILGDGMQRIDAAMATE